jgi:membrane-associated phospholipid phosphatase
VQRPAPPAPSRHVQASLLLLSALALIAYFPLDRRIGHVHDLATSLDARLPFVPLLAIPYLALLLILPAALLAGLRSTRGIAQIALALTLAYLVSDLFFIFYPTYAPRPVRLSGWGSEIVSFIYRNDAPYNDLPSEHVASAVLLAVYARPWKGVLRVGGLLLAILVVPSTVLIRQHTLIGALGGLVLAVLAWHSAGCILRGTRLKVFL